MNEELKQEVLGHLAESFEGIDSNPTTIESILTLIQSMDYATLRSKVRNLNDATLAQIQDIVGSLQMTLEEPRPPRLGQADQAALNRLQAVLVA